MTLGLEPETTTGSGSSLGRRRYAALAGGAILFALVGYAFGSHRGGTTIVTGPVQVGDHVATLMTDGLGYGASESVPWIDVNGALHEGGWPDCLVTAAPEKPPVLRFAVTHVEYPSGQSQEQVVYVDCRP
jgi:hypothetical protein